MLSTELEREVAGAEAYEALHVPALFKPWASRVLDAAGVAAGDRVLDVACGTGVLAREALERVGPRGRVVGIDAGEGMLAVARRLQPSIQWRAGRAESLPFEPAAFDRIVSQFGLMFFSDQHRAVREMHRVLRPGGTLAVAVWDALDRSEAYREAVDLLRRFAGADAAAALAMPFSLGEPAALQGLFEAGGLEDVAVWTQTGRACFPSLRTMVEADLRGWLPVMGVHLDELLIQTILEEAEQVLGDYVNDIGEVEFSAPAHVVTGRRPV